MWLMRDQTPPTICPRCASSRTVRVLWECVYLCRNDAVEVESGKAIVANPQVVLNCASWQALMRCRAGTLPQWACLTCSPGWLQVHQLAMQDYRWQLEKEDAVAASNFGRASELRALQDKDRDGLVALVARMLGEQDSAASHFPAEPPRVPPVR